jgi:hypothetical protein
MNMSEVHINSINKIFSGSDVVSNSEDLQTVAQKPPQNRTCFIYGKKNMNGWIMTRKQEYHSVHVSRIRNFCVLLGFREPF